MPKNQPIGLLETPPVQAASFKATLMAYVELTKPRIMLLLLYTGLCGMLVAAHRLPSLLLVIETMIGLVLSTGGSAALNMWYDRDIDRVMKRTRNRPIPAGLVKAEWAFAYGVILIAASFLELLATVNLLTAVLALLGAFYYVVIYTFWLKRRTPQNIVIGGGAGAFPPLIGVAAVTGHVTLSGFLLFLIIFFWTPPHFWSLAVYKNEEYRLANIPMMPVTNGERQTKIQSLVYGVVLLISSVLLPWTTHMSWIYEVVAIVLNGVFLYYLVLSFREETGKYVFARKAFFCSIVYLSVLFLAAAVCSLF